MIFASATIHVNCKINPIVKAQLGENTTFFLKNSFFDFLRQSSSNFWCSLMFQGNFTRNTWFQGKPSNTPLLHYSNVGNIAKSAKNHTFWTRTWQFTPCILWIIYDLPWNQLKTLKIILINQDESIKPVHVSHNIEKTVNTRIIDSQKSPDLPKTIPPPKHSFQIRISIFSLHSGDVGKFSDGFFWTDQFSNSPCFRFNFKTPQSEKIF